MIFRRLSPACAAIALAAAAAPAPALAQGPDSARPAAPRNHRVEPYIEAAQVFTARISPVDDVVTYTQVAAGVDASVTGRQSGGSASVRYERSFGYDNRTADTATLSGVARGYATVVPQAVMIEGGALATRSRIAGNGGAGLAPGIAAGSGGGGSESRIYAAYAGPSVHTQAGDAQINAHYRIGYIRIESPDAVVSAPGAAPVDVFDDSVVQNAAVHVAARPGDVLPVGVGLGGTFYQEDVANLDQRVRDLSVRADVSVPLAPDLAAVGGVGYEKVTISSRDAVRDAAGAPVIGSDGRFVTDQSTPRRIAYDTSGLIWDVGVMWRPSTRTSLEAHVGRRYDSTTYYGSFAWAPTSRSALSVSVYDGITGFGGQLNNALASLPTEFTAARNAISGDVTGCVASLKGGNCLTGALGSVRSSIYRGRGVAATYSEQLGRLTAGIGAGYSRRSFIAAQGTVLAAANGVADENWWLNGFVSGPIDQQSSFSLNSYASLLRSGFANAGDATVIGASAAYRRHLLNRLSANAALGVDRIDSDVAGQDAITASALVGLRYDF